MADAWIVNASPVIVLAKAGHLDLLDEPGVEVLVPEAVALEILAGPTDDSARRALDGGWGTRLAVATVPSNVLEWGLGAGESAVIAAAVERPRALAVIDDAQARSCAAALAVPVIGTLGLVLRAARRGRIPAATPAIRDLRAAGLFLDDALIREALDRALGERWEP